MVCASDRRSALEAIRSTSRGRHARPGCRRTRTAPRRARHTCRNLFVQPDTKVIVATGHGGRESALRAIAMGAYDFYRKPVDTMSSDDRCPCLSPHEIEQENRRLDSRVSTSLARSSTLRRKWQRSARRSRGWRARRVVMLLGAAARGRNAGARGARAQPARGRLRPINCAAIPKIARGRTVRL